MKHSLRNSLLALSLLTCVPALSACAGLGAAVADVAENVSGSTTPSQVTTLAEAVQASTLVTQAVTVAVQGHFIKDVATLEQLRALNNGLSAALHTWQNAADKNNDLYMASFNAALAAFNAFSTAKAIPH